MYKPEWLPKLNFITIHYAYILFAGLSGLFVLYPHGNISAIDSYFFGVSASTESGLNTVDLKELPTYQQVYTYIIAMVTNVSFVNIAVIVVRLHWFKKKLKYLAPYLLKADNDISIDSEGSQTGCDVPDLILRQVLSEPVNTPRPEHESKTAVSPTGGTTAGPKTYPRITFAPDLHPHPDSGPGSKALYVPPPRDRDNGHPITERDACVDETDGSLTPLTLPPPPPPTNHTLINLTEDETTVIQSKIEPPRPGLIRRTTWGSGVSNLPRAVSIARVATTVGTAFVLGQTRERLSRVPSPASVAPRPADLPLLSKQVTIGRNSQFMNLTSEDRERLGGIEYRALKVLLKITLAYFFGLHLLGVISLVPWIHSAPQKYKDVLDQNAVDWTWWGIYSAQTMANNSGFTLTPDSMVSFRDATWPMLIMTLMAYAGNTCYPVFLRLVIWAVFKLSPRKSSVKEALKFLLDHPRRCYTLLFPSRPTWILFGIVIFLNLADVVLIIALDINNPAVNDLSLGPRILSSLFQAASARHTGTSTYFLAQVNPAVQFSLLVMMYISVLPIAISIRASNTYEEKSLGIYMSGKEEELDESKGASYVLAHVRNQLSFDLWYIFLGTFCICVAEADKIMEPGQTAFQVFPIFFEVMSAYGCVGLSLGHPSVMTSLCGKFTTFSKVVICLMMIRGRHRGLPYALDRAIMLPNEQVSQQGGLARAGSSDARRAPSRGGLAKTLPLKSHHTR